VRKGEVGNEGAIQGVEAWQGLVRSHEPCVVTAVTFVERGLGRQFTGVAGYCMIAFVHIFVASGDVNLMEYCSYYYACAPYVISDKLPGGTSLYIRYGDAKPSSVIYRSQVYNTRSSFSLLQFCTLLHHALPLEISSNIPRYPI